MTVSAMAATALIYDSGDRRYEGALRRGCASTRQSRVGPVEAFGGGGVGADDRRQTAVGPDSVEPVVATGKVSVRSEPDDLLLLRERANGASHTDGTYVSLLVRSHLRS